MKYSTRLFLTVYDSERGCREILHEDSHIFGVFSEYMEYRNRQTVELERYFQEYQFSDSSFSAEVEVRVYDVAREVHLSPCQWWRDMEGNWYESTQIRSCST